MTCGIKCNIFVFFKGEKGSKNKSVKRVWIHQILQIRRSNQMHVYATQHWW